MGNASSSSGADAVQLSSEIEAYFTASEQEQMDLLQKWLKGNVLFWLHKHKFFQRELPRECQNAKKNNLLVQLLQAMTSVPAYGDVSNTPGLFAWLFKVFKHAEACEGECSKLCSRACALQVIANLASTRETLDSISKPVADAGFLIEGAKLREVCPATVRPGIAMLDKLLEHDHRILDSIVDDQLFANLLSLLEKQGEDGALQQHVQSVLINLAKVDKLDQLFDFNGYVLTKRAVEGIEQSRDVPKALVLLTCFAGRNSRKMVSECKFKSIWDKVLKFCVSESTAKLPAIQLVAIFLTKGECTPPTAEWVAQLESTVNTATNDRQLAMWSALCLALLEDVPLRLALTNEVLQELVKLLQRTNAKEDFPLELVLAGIKRVLQSSEVCVTVMREAELDTHLMGSLKVASGNEDVNALRNGLACLEVAMHGKEAVKSFLTQQCEQSTSEEDVAVCSKVLLEYYSKTKLKSEAKKPLPGQNPPEDESASATTNEPQQSKKAKTQNTRSAKRKEQEKDEPGRKRQQAEDKLPRVLDLEVPSPAAAAPSRARVKADERPPIKVPTVAATAETTKDVKITIVREVLWPPNWFSSKTPSSSSAVSQLPTSREATTKSEERSKSVKKEAPVVAPAAVAAPARAPAAAAAPVPARQSNAKATNASPVEQGLVSRSEYDILQANQLTLDVLLLLEEFRTDLRELGISSLSATRLLVSAKPEVCKEAKDLPAAAFAQSLVDSNKIRPEEAEILTRHGISRNVLVHMQDECFADASIAGVFKAKLKSWVKSYND